MSGPALYSARRVCNFSRVRFLLPIPLALALLGAGCSTPMERFNKKLAKQEGSERAENSRTVEQRRMMEAESGQAGSQRGAEILVPNKYKEFDPSRNAVGGRSYNAGQAHTKSFLFAQKAKPESYRAGDFYGSKKAWGGNRLFGAKDANIPGPFGAKIADTRTAATKEAWDAGRSAPTRALTDGKREYLGPESKKLRQTIDPVTMADWRNTGESVMSTGSSVEKYSTMKSLTIEDIRELLNKNK